MLSVPVELLILACLVLANGLLAMAETAVVSARKTSLRKLAHKGDPRAAKALSLAEQPMRFLALVEFWLTLSGMIAGVMAGAKLSDDFAGWLLQSPTLAPHARTLGLIGITIALTSFMLLFGELLPKRVGRAYPEKVAVLLARLVTFLAKLAAPLLWVFEVATEALAKLL